MWCKLYIIEHYSEIPIYLPDIIGVINFDYETSLVSTFSANVHLARMYCGKYMAAADASIFGFPTAERTNLKTCMGFILGLFIFKTFRMTY
jgi:hypothetical protein